MANEFVTKKFLDAAGVKVLWDEIGLEIAAEAKAREDAVKAEEEARIAADSALDTKITTLSGVVDGVSSKATQNAADIDVLEGKVAALESGTYDDTEVRGLIKDNKDAIDAEVIRAKAAEEANAEAIAAVDAALKLAIENDKEGIDSIKELATWVNTHGTEAAAMADAIDTLEGKVDVEKVSTAIATANSEAITAAAEDATTKANAAKEAAMADTATKDAAMNARVAKLEANEAGYATTGEVATAKQEAIDAATAAAATDAQTKADAAKTAAIAAAALDATAKADQAEIDAIAAAATDATQKANAAEANAKAYADGLAGNYDAAGSAAAAETAAKSYADAEAAKAYAAIDALSAAEIRKAIGRTTE